MLRSPYAAPHPLGTNYAAGFCQYPLSITHSLPPDCPTAEGHESRCRVAERRWPAGPGLHRRAGPRPYPALFRKDFGSSTITEDNTLKALAQFERTLISGSSRYDQFQRGNRAALTGYEQQGLVLFVTHPDGAAGIRGGNCKDCHDGPLQTDYLFHNNGLDATFTDLGLGSQTGRPTDNGKFPGAFAAKYRPHGPLHARRPLP